MMDEDIKKKNEMIEDLVSIWKEEDDDRVYE